MSKIKRYFYALLVFAAIFCLRLLLHPVFGTYMPYQLFFYAGVVTSFFWGGGPGSVIVLLGTVTGSYFFVEPYLEFTMATTRDVVLLTNYLLSCMLVIVAIEYLQRARHKSDLLLRVSESRYKTLLHRDNQRMLLERQARQSAST